MKKAISIILIFSVFISLNGCALITKSRKNNPYQERIEEKTKEGSTTGGAIGGLIGLLLGIGITAALSSGISEENKDTVIPLFGFFFIPVSAGLGMFVGSSIGHTAGYFEATGGRNYEFVPHYPKQLNYNQELRINNLQPFLLTNYW